MFKTFAISKKNVSLSHIKSAKLIKLSDKKQKNETYNQHLTYLRICYGFFFC